MLELSVPVDVGIATHYSTELSTDTVASKRDQQTTKTLGRIKLMIGL